MLKKTLVALSVATVSAGATALPLAASHAAGAAVQIAACNPCSPCAAAAKKPVNPCSPCAAANPCAANPCAPRSEEHTSELQSLMRISYAVFCLKKKNRYNHTTIITTITNKPLL